MNTITNKVSNCPTISWNIIKEWEFNQLKDNSNRDVKKLKKSILNNGFIAPFDCWKNDSKNYVFDGTGRHLALLQLETEGYDIPELPVLFIEAKNLKEAKKYALQKSSTHGQITQTSLADFTSDDFEIDELKDLALEEFSLEPLDYMIKSMEEPIIDEKSVIDKIIIRVYIECQDENMQEKIFNHLQELGYEPKLQNL